jgi:hypothetical protein
MQATNLNESESPCFTKRQKEDPCNAIIPGYELRKEWIGRLENQMPPRGLLLFGRAG